MNDTLCEKIDFLRKHLPDDLKKTTSIDIDDNSNFVKYCPENVSGDKICNTYLDKITAGFLWLLGECYSTVIDKSYKENNTNAFFLYMISWFSYKLNQITGNKFTKINDLYTNHVKNSGKYKTFITDAYRIGNLEEFMRERNDLLNIDIEDLSKFYDAFKLLCNIHGNFARNEHDTLSNNITSFIEKYTELNNNCNIEGTLHNQILSALSTDYNNLKNDHKDFPSIPEIETKFYAQTSRVTSLSSSTGNKLFLVLSIFGAIAFFLGISYKYSLFGFRKRAQKQYLREKIKNIKKKLNH
ncbi:PIR protein [Plasmodium yoelii]|uniref:PIR protein n=2 Tax=Plasmodium yoelii TaxID=5861 RepID=A0AAE9X022_PLAYO|nr:PIR protein [Plasmodium yoelii]WBY59567.1 PIR protein [Plasmodium yoelii yoelii]VTZ80309.1 PIR protein [Plasmodium yoelii]|eukprot:XP_034493578.1 PIR protein [Plasmodium yoelii]